MGDPILQGLAGLVTGLNLLLSLGVGLRLLSLARRTRGLPEVALAVYFLMSAVLSTPPQIIVYAGLGDPSLRVAEPLARGLLAFAVLAMAIGAAGIYVFTWRTFRRDRLWAKLLVFAGCALLAGGYAMEAALEGFAPVIFAGAGHWIGWVGRSGATLWVAIESIRYFVGARRRLHLGLADPMVTERFLLWGVWSATSFLNYVADLASRGVYVFWAGTTEILPAILEPVIITTIFATMVLGIVSAATLFLTFFPTAAYRRWVESRATAPTA